MYFDILARYLLSSLCFCVMFCKIIYPLESLMLLRVFKVIDFAKSEVGATLSVSVEVELLHLGEKEIDRYSRLLQSELEEWYLYNLNCMTSPDHQTWCKQENNVASMYDHKTFWFVYSLCASSMGVQSLGVLYLTYVNIEQSLWCLSVT